MSKTSDRSRSGCPSSESLTAFILGRISVDEVEFIGEHVIQCARCEALLNTLQKRSNTVFSRLRQAARRKSDALDELIAEPEYQEFAMHACAISIDRATPTESTRVFPTEPDQAAGPVPEQISRYLITREIGRGGFGRVYLAFDPLRDRQVAIKVPRREKFASADSLERFLGEAKIVEMLDHPAIARVLDWGCTDDTGPFVVMEYINGQTLAEVLSARLLDRRSLIEIIISVAQGLHHAHQSGLVHRDVKPQNILISATNRPFVVDFGLAIRDEEQWDHRGELAGTRTYMAPEQVRRESHRLDGRTDLWALGVILFQVLTGRPPFSGKTVEQLEDEIQQRDPKPPRQIDDTIPEDLERICLKCLSKKMTERYSTALELAKELQRSSESSPAFARPTGTNFSTVIPKGVRSFGPEDQHFFLSLLPGPRDAMGLPDALRSWKSRLELTDPDSVSPVAVLYGPSGCGKTSFVRAGLLPRLSPNVVYAYIDAGSLDVEVRLLTILQNKCRQLPKSESLVETIARLRSGTYFPVGCTKCVVVVDQFEQWLHVNGEFNNQPLVQALRQCDGEHVQCLILVRDDFWMALTRFMSELEIPLLEGTNSASVDLFDTRHARRVLSLFGTALGTLPAIPDEVTSEQNTFMDSAIDQLAVDGRVVCVRLAMFAEMVKSKPWKPETLRQLGGIAGVGVTFLEESFGRSAPARHRQHQEPIRAILAALLPRDGTDIRDHVQSRESLLTASGYNETIDRFEDVLRILDLELRLITPVEIEVPDESNDSLVDRGGGNRSELPVSGQYYQLTHDYLVPSIRDWLDCKRRETRRGRAELLLAERARLWNATQDRKQLPSLYESFQIRFLTRKRDRNSSESKLLKAAFQHHGIRTAIGLAVLMVVSVIMLNVYGRVRGTWLIDSLRTAEMAQSESVIQQIQDNSFWTRAILRDAMLPDRPQEALDSSQRLRFDLAAYSLGDQVDLINSIVRAAPQELALILKIIKHEQHVSAMSQQLWAVLKDEMAADDHRFRAACALANLDPEHREWTVVALKVAELLLSQERYQADEWVELLRPVGVHLAEPLQHRFVQMAGQDAGESYIAALALAEFCQKDLDRLIVLLKNSASEHVLYLQKLDQSHSEAIVRLEAAFAETVSPTSNHLERDSFTIKQARLGTALMLLGKPESVWPAFEHQPDPTLRIHLIDQLAAWHVDPVILWKQVRLTSSASAKYALILALGEYPKEELLAKLGDEFLNGLNQMYEADPDSGVHSAAAWLLRALNRSQMEQVRQRQVPGSDASNKEWFLDVEGHTLVVINKPGAFLMGSPINEADRQADEKQHTRTIDYSFAIATTPVTIAQYQRSGGNIRSGTSKDLNCPLDYADHFDAMKYCNWLSSQNNIPKEEWCYELREYAGKSVLQPVDAMLSKSGYRLPTEAEWEFACRANTDTRRFCGNSSSILVKYAWCLDNSEGHLHPVAQLRPNEFGLFDMYGNAYQWCQTSYHDYERQGMDGSLVYMRSGSQVCRGCSYDSRPIFARSARRNYSLSARLDAIGFRVARSVR